jgi:hypothetical protein
MKCKFVDPEVVLHSLNSVLTCTTRVEIFESLSKIVVSSANRKLNSLEQLGRSLILIRNSRGPILEPSGTPRSI